MALEEEKDVTIETKVPSKQEAEAGVPRYLSKLTLSPEQQDAIFEEIEAELKQCEEERKMDGLEAHWGEMDNLWQGKLRDAEDQQFNLSKRTAKTKMMGVIRAAEESFFEIDPRFSVTPRPDFDGKDGEQVTQKQEDFLDYKFDEVIPLQPEMSKVFKQAVDRGIGILKYTWETRRTWKKREERYVGKIEPIVDQNKQPVMDPTTGQPATKNEGLQEFVRNYPDASNPESKYYPYFFQLRQGKTINIVVKYRCTEYDDPMPKFVDRKNFYNRRADAGYVGLCRSRFHAEKIDYSWWELKKMEDDNRHFYNIEKLMFESDTDKDEPAEKRKKLANYDHKDYPIFECVYWTKLKATDKEETRCVFWVNREKKLMIGSIAFPYYTVDSYYIPFSIKQERAMFDQPGIGEDMKDSSIAEDALLNFILEGYWLKNQATPIVKEGSEVESQFLEKRWAHGVPITLGAGDQAPDWLNKYMAPMEAGVGMQLVQYLVMGQEDMSGVSSGMSGRENPIDPTAPASKTLALLERSSLNVKAYIRVLVQSFNLIPMITLQYYEQMSGESQKYRIKQQSMQVAGADPFGVIDRSEMRARTTIQSQASAFNFHKNNEKREDLALFSTVRQEPLVARNPKAVYELLKNLIKGWSPKWKNRLDKILPTFEQFQQEQQQVAVQAVAQYVQLVLKQAKVTGQAPEFNVEALVAAVADFTAEAATPPSKEVQEARAKQQGAQ